MHKLLHQDVFVCSLFTAHIELSITRYKTCYVIYGIGHVPGVNKHITKNDYEHLIVHINDYEQ